MAEVVPVIRQYASKEGTGAMLVSWMGIKFGDTCAPVRTLFYPDRSIQVKGVPSGASVYIKGENGYDENMQYPQDADPQVLKDTSGLDAIYTTKGIRQLVPASYFTLPVVVGGDVDTDIDLVMLCVTSRN